MWVVWVIINFFITTFITSQVFGYLIFFISYPEYTMKVKPENRNTVVVALLIHCAITVVWVVLICTVESIRNNWILLTGLAILNISMVLKNEEELKRNYMTALGLEEEYMREQWLKAETAFKMFDNHLRTNGYNDKSFNNDYSKNSQHDATEQKSQSDTYYTDDEFDGDFDFDFDDSDFDD